MKSFVRSFGQRRYFVMLGPQGTPPPLLSPANVKTRAEAWLVEQFGQTVAGRVQFDIADAMEKLHAVGLVDAVGGGSGVNRDIRMYQAVDIEVAVERMRALAHNEVDVGGNMLPGAPATVSRWQAD